MGVRIATIEDPDGNTINLIGGSRIDYWISDRILIDTV